MNEITTDTKIKNDFNPHKKLNKKAEDFAKVIKDISEDKTIFISFLFLSSDEDSYPFEVEFFRNTYHKLCTEFNLKDAWEFDRVNIWFKNYTKNIQDEIIQNGIMFSDASYIKALDYLLIENGSKNEFKKTFCRVLLKLSEIDESVGYVASTIAANYDKLPEDLKKILFKFSEKDEATAFLAMTIAANFNRLPDDVRNLLFKLYEKAIGNSANTISVEQSLENSLVLNVGLSASDIIAISIANNYNELPENVRGILFQIFKTDLMAAGFIMSIASERKDKLFDDILNFLLKLSEKNDASEHVANIVRDNLDEIPEDIRIKLLLYISKNDGAADEIASIVRDNLDKFPDDIKTKLLLKLSEKEESAVEIACTIEDNFDKIPEMIRTKLLFKLSERNNADLVVTNIVDKKFDKLPEDARNILLFNLSEKEKFHHSVSNIIAKNFEKFSDDVIQKLLAKIHRTLQQIIEIIYINKYYLSKEKELQLISMFTKEVKVVNIDGDYYYCGLCDKWHLYRCDTTALGNKHVAYIDEKKMNIQVAKYYFCGFCNKWHTDVKTDHLKYRVQIRQCTNLKSASPIWPGALSSTSSHHTTSSIQSNEVLPKLRSRKNKEESFLINPMNTSVSLKFIKKIKTQKKPSLMRFVDNKLIYLDGSQKPYNLIKTNEFFEAEWKIHYLDTINNMYWVDKTIIVHTTKWESADSVHTKLWFINNNGAEVSIFNFNSYVRFSSFNSNVFVIWSVDSKIRNFNSAGDLLWDYDTNNHDKYDFKGMSISNTGLILYSVKDTAYLIDKSKRELIKWECPKEPVEKGSINVKKEVIVAPFNAIRALKISSDSKYILLGCYSGDLFCLNLQNQVIWHHKISSREISDIISSNNGENLVIQSDDGYIYFIEKGKIQNKYKLMNRKILAEYHNNKQQFFISDGKDFSIFDKSGTLLNKIIFKNDVNWFDISEKLNAIAIASTDGIDIFSI